MWYQQHRDLGHRQDRLQIPGEPQSFWEPFDDTKFHAADVQFSSVKRRSFWVSWLYSRTMLQMSTRRFQGSKEVHQVQVRDQWPPGQWDTQNTQLQYYETREDFQCMSTIDLSEVSDQTIIIETEILSSGRLRCWRTPLSLQTPRKLKPESAEDASSVSEARRQRYPGLTCSPRLLWPKTPIMAIIQWMETGFLDTFLHINQTSSRWFSGLGL